MKKNVKLLLVLTFGLMIFLLIKNNIYPALHNYRNHSNVEYLFDDDNSERRMLWERLGLFSEDTINCASPDYYRGTDTEKIQSAIDYAVNTGSSILLDREYTITHDLVINNPTDTTHKLVRFIGIANGAGFYMDGASFTGGEAQSRSDNGGISFVNVNFRGAHTNECLLTDGLLRIFFSECSFKDFANVLYGSYAQSIRFTNCYFWNISNAVFTNTQTYYDILFEGCICEASNAFVLHSDDQPDEQTAFSLRIVNCCIEGISSHIAARLGTSSSTVICNNYFENCSIDIQNSFLSDALVINNNIFFNKKDQASIIIPQYSRKRIGEIKNNVQRGNETGFLYNNPASIDHGYNSLLMDISENVYKNEFVNGSRSIIINGSNKIDIDQAPGNTVTLDLYTVGTAVSNSVIYIPFSLPFYAQYGYTLTDISANIINVGYSDRLEIMETSRSGFLLKESTYGVYTNGMSYAVALSVTLVFDPI